MKYQEDVIAIIDTGSLETVIGELGLTKLISGLKDEELQYIQNTQKLKKGCFVFGKTEYKILKEILLPCKIEEKSFNLKINVIEGDVPLLLGKSAMKNMKLKINLEEGTIDIDALNLVKIKTFENESGHTCILLNKKQHDTCWMSQFKENWIKEKK